jgi:type I restriction enzyme M protein
LSDYWDAFPALQSTLFAPSRTGYVDLAIEVGGVQASILGAEEFKQFTAHVQDIVAAWFNDHRDVLVSISSDTRPNDLITELGEDLLARFQHVPLLDEYDVYEQLLSYWHESMHDDVFLIMRESWVGASRPRAARIVGTDQNGKPKYEDADIKRGSRASTERYVMDLVPPAVVIARFLSYERTAVDELDAVAKEAARVLEEFLDEYAVEEGLVWDAMDEKGKVTLKSAKDVLSDAKRDHDDEVVGALTVLLGLIKTEADANKAAKAALGELETAALKRYASLTSDDVKSLVLDDKWFSDLSRRIRSTVDGLTLALVNRIEELGDRYDATVSELDERTNDIESRVEAHLIALGIR